jgi:hypothetical protein
MGWMRLSAPRTKKTTGQTRQERRTRGHAQDQEHHHEHVGRSQGRNREREREREEEKKLQPHNPPPLLPPSPCYVAVFENIFKPSLYSLSLLSSPLSLIYLLSPLTLSNFYYIFYLIYLLSSLFSLIYLLSSLFCLVSLSSRTADV